MRRLGYALVPVSTLPEIDSLHDFTPEQKKIIETARSFSMTGVARLATLVNAVTYVTEHRIPGDFVECGVWRGGSMMAMALTLISLGDTSRDLYLYDTYEGMSEPTAHDTKASGALALDQYRAYAERNKKWCYASLEDVRENIRSTGYPEARIQLIKGKVEDTIPQRLPGQVAILRLDTDWYESTRHELTHLYPRLSGRGLMILDDYGHWAGAKKAVDEYFAGRREAVYLHRIDYTGRLMMKVAE